MTSSLSQSFAQLILQFLFANLQSSFATNIVKDFLFLSSTKVLAWNGIPRVRENISGSQMSDLKEQMNGFVDDS